MAEHEKNTIPTTVDDSAPRTTKLAEPHRPLPKTKENPDILHVTRTWNFLPGGSLVDE